MTNPEDQSADTDPHATTPVSPEVAPMIPEPEDIAEELTFGAVFKQLGPAGPASVLAAVAPAIGGFVLLGSMGIVGKWITSQGPLGVVVYIAVFAITSGLAILPTYAQAALGGWAFGAVFGAGYAVLGLTGGALIGCLLARRFTGGHVASTIDRYPKAKIIRDALVPAGDADRSFLGWLKTLGIITLVRVPPNSPFALTNLLMGSLRLPISAVLIGTVVGMIPRTALVAYVASLIQGEISSAAAKEARPPWLLPVGIGVSVLVFFILLVLSDRAMRKVANAGDAEGADGGASDATPDA